MALQGSFESTAYDSRCLEFSWTATQNLAANQSTITWTLKTVGTGDYSQYYAGRFKVLINGTQQYYSSTRVLTFDGTVIKTDTLTLNHSVDGSCEFSVYIEAGIYTYAVNCSGSETFELDDIPRAATIVSAPDFNDEITSIPITYSNLVGNTASQVEVAVCSSDGNTILLNYRAVPITGTTYTIRNITDSERAALRNYITRGHTATIAYKMRTTINSTYHYSDLYRKTLSLINYLPVLSIGMEDVSDANSEYIEDNQRFFQGVNTIEYAFTAAAQKGATIASYQIECGGQVKTTNIGTFYNVNTNLFTVSATDTRGNTTSLQYDELSMITYSPVTCNQEVSLELEGETGAVRVVMEGFYKDDLEIDAPNRVSTYYVLKEKDAEGQNIVLTGGTRTYSENHYREEYVVSDLDYTKTYIIKSRAQDNLTTTYSSEYVIKFEPVFDWSETDFNFNVPISIQGQEMNDFVVEQGTSNSWIYRKWNSGVAECWRRVQVSTAITNAWGSLYTSGALAATNLTYPFTFVELPYLQVSLMPFGSGAMLMAPGSSYGNTTQTGSFEIARGTANSSSSQYLLSYYAIGRWK